MIQVLLISNNPFSSTENNGKTLASFFRGWEDVSVRQLYFRPEKPDGCFAGEDVAKGYYQVTDADALHRRAGTGYEPCLYQPSINQEAVEAVFKASWRTKPFARNLRELVWRRYNFLDVNSDWVKEMDDNPPDIIFFCAGDSHFAYNITQILQERWDCPLVLYVTDDYILPYSGLSPVDAARRKKTRNLLIETARRSAMFFTIGEKMRRIYKDKYDLSGQALVNMSEDHASPYPDYQELSSRALKLVYAGGLHYERDRVLSLLAQACVLANERLGARVFSLEIYAPATVPANRLQELNTDASVYYGPISAEEVEIAFRSADILVFAEATSQEAVRATCLSLSTKVPEYLSYQRAIFTIGSSESASVEYLEPYSITAKPDLTELTEVLVSIAEQPAVLTEMAHRAYQRFLSHHAPEQVKSDFRKSFLAALPSATRTEV